MSFAAIRLSAIRLSWSTGPEGGPGPGLDQDGTGTKSRSNKFRVRNPTNNPWMNFLFDSVGTHTIEVF